MSVLWSDLRLGVRQAMKAPGFSLAAIATLALAIGPNTAIFSVVHATFLAPLPFADPDQLVMIWSKSPSGGRSTVSPGDAYAWKEAATSFSHLDPFTSRMFNLSTDTEPLRVRVRLVTPDGHRMLGEGMALGRDFLPEDDDPGKNQVMLLSNRLWRTHFGADPGIVGRDVRMDGRPYTVVGVMPAGVNDRIPADLWIPLTFTPQETGNHAARRLLMKGRLKPGVSVEQAQHEMTSIAAALARRVPETNTGWGVSVEPLQNNFLPASTRTMLYLLLAAVGFVVAIACVNVANLLLARGTVQEREMAIRASLGASRTRIIRQVITTSLVIALAGGLLGVLSAAWILQALLLWFPRGTLPAEADPQLSVPVLIFALLTTTGCALLFGSAPAWQASRVDVNDVLKQSGRSSVAGGRRRLRHALVLVELALAVTSLAGAGLAVHSFWKRSQVDLGVRTEHTLTFSLPVTSQQLSSPERVSDFYRRLVDRLRETPRVTQASVSSSLPLQGNSGSMPFHIAGMPACEPTACPEAAVRSVTPGFFETFGGAIVRGRGFTDQDTAGRVRVAVVSEQFVAAHLRDVDPLLQRIEQREAGSDRSPAPPVEWQIVGVFRTINNSAELGEASHPEVVLPFWQAPRRDAFVAVRTDGDPDLARMDVAAAVRSLDPDLPVMNVRTMMEIVRERLAPDMRNMALYGALAVVALVLAALGVYGVMAFSVAQRAPEIGLRMALGAAQASVRRQILIEGLKLAAGGLALGMVGAYMLGRAMQSTLFGVDPINPAVLVAVSAVLLAAAAAACYVPARRASSVDPMVALRQE